MKVKDKKWIRVRIYLVAFSFLLGLVTILLRAFQLQVLERDRLDSIARAGYHAVVKMPPKRGTIYDREGHELAVSVEVGSIYANPNEINEKLTTAGQLALNLDLSQESILSLLKKDRDFVWIQRRVSPEKIQQVKALNLKGVGFTTEDRRYYPGMDIAGHLLGIVGTDNQGLEGLEKKYDKILTGSQQTLVQMRDALGRPFLLTRAEGDNQDMRNLVLTIDKDIQYKAQQALEAALEKAEGKSGQCLIMDPDTGEILAMAVAPSFNPNIFSEYRPYQWRNRTITDCYEPGSTIKAFLLAAALEDNVVAPGTTFYCENGKLWIGSIPIGDNGHKYGDMSVSDIIVKSSNIGAVKIGQELGYGKFYEYLKKFGFGEESGIDLIGEREGFVRPLKSAEPIDQATAFFGQGLSATSLQLVTAMAAIANGGKLMKPFVVKAITNQSGKIIKEYHPQIVRRIISQETAQKVTKILEGVVSDRGTAPDAAITGFRAAGKTGTSQKVDPSTKTYSKKYYVAIFTGFVPAENPKLVILVMIDEPRGVEYGGPVAGPVFKEVGKWTLNNLRIPPEVRLVETQSAVKLSGSENREIHAQPSIGIDSVGLLPDFTGQTIREVLKRGSALGLKVILEGSGMAIKQTPEPGSPLEEVSSVKVSFRPPA